MSEKWISAIEARSMISLDWQDEGKPTDAICLHAKFGEIKAKARRWITIENGQKFEKLEEIIPTGFWADPEMKQDWFLGNFESTIYPDDSKFETVALGVMFDRADIAALVRSAEPTMPPNAGSPLLRRGSTPEGPPPEPSTNANLPPLSRTGLEVWWNGLSEQERNLPRERLYRLCRAAHPHNSITRARVRAFAPQLKPGPRPIKPNSSA